MAKDLLNTYKYGLKLYYQNTMDGKVEDVITDPNSERLMIIFHH